MHLQHRFHSVESWRALQHLSLSLLPLRHLVPAVPGQLHGLLHEHVLHPVCRVAACSAWRDLVRCWLPERRVCERNRMHPVLL